MNGGSNNEVSENGILTRDEELFYEQLRVYIARARTATLSGPLAWALLAFIQSTVAPYSVILLWIAVLAVPEALTLYYARRFEHFPPGPADYRRWRYRQHALHALSGLAWGVAPILFRQPGDLVGELVIYLFMVGVTASCITVMSPFRTAVAAFTGVTWLPTAIYLVWIGDKLHMQLFTGLLVLVAVENAFAWVANRQLKEGIEQAVSNRRLSEALVLARDGLHRANRELEAKNAQLTSLTNRLRELAIHDDLTGAYNRRYLITQIEEEIAVASRHGVPATLLMLDIDHFKHVNDHYGHLAGDGVLREVAEIIQASLRESDVFARYGGEEFVVALRMTPRDEATALAERLRRKVAEHSFRASIEDQRISVSIGVAEFLAGDRSETWLERADSALYQAKASGRNRVATYAQRCLPLPEASRIEAASRDISSVERLLAGQRLEEPKPV